MKIVNAVWEKRNLGVDTVEITFEKKDSEKEVEDFLDKLESEYIVLKVPTDLSYLLPIIQNKGYRYIEDMVGMSNYLQDVCRNSVEERIYNAVSVEIMNDMDMDILYKEIRKGIFDSDRVYLDPFFNHILAQTRYINWIKDEKEIGTDFLKYVYKLSGIPPSRVRSLNLLPISMS